MVSSNYDRTKQLTESKVCYLVPRLFWTFAMATGDEPVTCACKRIENSCQLSLKFDKTFTSVGELAMKQDRRIVPTLLDSC